ncbi:hypothetical protein MKX03_009571 [Papaver bracteatum]|nr:hypothetical protein MKX03_009571 [Papaver bracteatum]
MEIDLTPKSSKSVYGGEGGSYSHGSGTAGIILYEAEKEKVIAVKEGDAIALPFGVVTWWFNKEDTELVILFMGDISKGHKAGEFTEFALTGANGIFTGFTTEFVGQAWD